MASRWVMLWCMLLVGVTLRGAPAPGEELTLVRVKYTVDTNDPRHREDWNAKAFAHVLCNVSSQLSQTISIHTAPEPKVLTLEDGELPSYPFLFMAGHFGVVFKDSEVLRLREHLTKGGFLLATACCGNPSFARSFAREMKRVFPKAELKPLPPEHLVYRSLYAIESVTCLSGADLSNPHQERAPLQGIEINGRVAVIFSPKALTCGWTQSGTCIPSCERIAPEDARKLAANIVVFALTH